MDELSRLANKAWDFFVQWGVIGISLGASLIGNILQGKIIWELIQFLKKLLGKDDVKKD